MTFQELLEDNGYDTRSYSGRAMYGQECLAVTVDDVISSTWAIATLLAEYNAEAEEKIPEPKGMRYDNMGRSYVIYWTRVPYVEDESHPMSGAL
jgi:hypothetical protein